MTLSDRWLTFVTRTAACVSATIVLFVLTFLVRESWPAVQSLGLARFLADDSWHPLSDEFRLTPMIVATLLTSVGAIAIAVPLGLSSAIFNCFYATAMIAVWQRRLMELLAGIPSVVFGLWGLTVLAPLVAQLGGSGQSLLTATVVLALMVLPTIAIFADASLRAVPRESIHGAAALGLQRGAIVWSIALPAARRGIIAGVVLALTRALGETMAVLMLAGNIPAMPTSALSPVRTLNANIALELGYASATHRSILFVSGLLLMAVVATTVLIASVRTGASREAV